MPKDRHALVLCDVRNSTNYKYVGFSTTATDFIENIIYWPGISPTGQVQRRPVDSVGNWTNNTGIFVSPTPTINVFKGIVNAGGKSSQPARTLTTFCKTDSRGIECPIIISTGATIFDTVTKKPIFTEYVNFQSSVLAAKLTDFSLTLPGSVIVLIEQQSGKIMAASDSRYLLTKSNGTQLRDATEYGNPLAAQAASYLKSAYGPNYSGFGIQKNQTQNARFNFDDKISGVGNVLADATYIYDDTGIQWIAVLAVSEQAFTGQYLYPLISVTIIGALLAILSLLTGIIVSVIIVRSLLRLLREMTLVQNMQLDDTDSTSLSGFSEVRAMQKGFHIMVERLKEYKAFLPSYILNRDFGDAEEDNVDEENNPLASSKFGSSLRKGKLDAASSHASSHSDMTKRSSSKLGQVGLNVREVSVVHLKITNLDRMLKLISPKEVLLQHGKIQTEILRLMKQCRGDLTYVDEKQFIMSWNAAIHVKKHATEACFAACALKRFCTELTDEFGMLVDIGAATGDLYCGAIGTASKKQFSMFGRAKELASQLCTLNSALATRVLINETMYRLAFKEYEIRPVMKVVLKEEVGNYEDTAYELVVQKKLNTHDEWMYEMDREAKSNEFSKFYQSYQLILEGNVEEATQSLISYLQEIDADDVVATQLISLYEQMKHKESKTIQMELGETRWKLVY
jgi:class 3 adenylate cyclase